MSERERSVAAGPFFVGLVLLGLIIHSILTAKMQFLYLNTILLVVLSLGAALINKR